MDRRIAAPHCVPTASFGAKVSHPRVESSDGSVRKCSFSVPPAIPARVSLRVDYQTGIVKAALVNVDRLDRVTLEFHSNDIEEPILEDLVKLILGRDSAFLRRAPLAGMRRSSWSPAERFRMSPSNLLWGLLVGSMVIGLVLLMI